MFSNVRRAIMYQIQHEDAWKNIFVTHVAFGIFSQNAHTTQGKPKVAYSTKQQATKAASSMEKKTGKVFSAYKCCFCDGYHIGKDKS